MKMKHKDIEVEVDIDFILLNEQILVSERKVMKQIRTSANTILEKISDAELNEHGNDISYLIVMQLRKLEYMK